LKILENIENNNLYKPKITINIIDLLEKDYDIHLLRDEVLICR
jgi:hypothetical protein